MPTSKRIDLYVEAGVVAGSSDKCVSEARQRTACQKEKEEAECQTTFGKGVGTATQ